MTFLLELRERWLRYYEKHEKWILIISKFGIALLALILLNNEIGFFSLLKNPFFIGAAAVVCALTPGIVTLVILSGFLLVHLFVMSLSLGLVMVVILTVMYLFFFRFCPKANYVLLVTMLFFPLHIPFVIPVILALFCPFSYVIALDFGAFLYYAIHTIGNYSAMLTRQTVVDNAHSLSYIAGSFVGNREMIATLIAFTATFIITNLIRKSSAEYSGFYAIITGVITQFIFLVLTNIWLDANISLAAIIVQTIVEMGIAILCNAVFFGADYTRTEHFRFEDDDYFYFVKAVPKRRISVSDVKVTHINARNIRDKQQSESEDFLNNPNIEE